MTGPRTRASRGARSVAARAAAVGRLEPPGGAAVLALRGRATVALFDAEAASIVLHDPETDRLVIRVAAGTAGDGAVGLSFAPAEGIAGYVFTTGQPLAVGDVTADPRFGRSRAEATGYVPRSILAVPLLDDDGTIGVSRCRSPWRRRVRAARHRAGVGVSPARPPWAIRAGRVERDVAELRGAASRRWRRAGIRCAHAGRGSSP